MSAVEQTEKDRLVPRDSQNLPDELSEQNDDHSINNSPEEITNGLTVWTTAVFIMGEMAGSGMLALPLALVHTGWVGVLLIPVCCVVSGYNGVNLGRCWTLLQERDPEYRTQIRQPYPLIGEQAVGKWMRYVVSVCVDLTLFGVATVFLILASQNLQSLLGQAGVHVNFCAWLLLMAAFLVPLSWLGTPKDFWPIAIGASAATGLAAILIVTGSLTDSSAPEQPVHSSPSFKNFFLGFGAILFSFGGAATFPTIQNDMKEPKKFPVSVVIAYVGVLSVYVPVAVTGFLVYGDVALDNVLRSLPGNSWLRLVAEALITAHLLCAFVIAMNPLSQEFEEIFKIPHGFTWKRCVLRTVIVAAVLFVAESIPHFGALLDLVGGSTVTFLTFVAPSLFYLCLVRQTERSVPLYITILNIEIMAVGVVGGIASTYSALFEITGPGTFVSPCYVDPVAAGGAS